MQLKELLKKNRSYRRFLEAEKVPSAKAEQWIKNLRYTSSMRNAQPLKYILIQDPKLLDEIYPTLRWAGYLKEWDGPAKGERPSLLVVQLLDKNLSSSSRFDEGIQLAALTLQASEEGYGCCIIGAFDAAALTAILSLPEQYKPLTIVAVGRPSEQVEIEELQGNQIQYYRTPDEVHHVPKRKGDELLLSLPSLHEQSISPEETFE